MIQNLPNQAKPPADRAKRRRAQQTAPAAAQGRLPGWLDRQSVARKLALAGSLFILPTAIALISAANFMNQVSQPISRAGHIIGLARDVDALQSSLDTYSLTLAAQRAGGADAAALQTAAKSVDAAMTALDQNLNSNVRPNPFSRLPEMKAELRKTWPAIKLQQSWDAYRQQAAGALLSGTAGDYQALGRLIQQINQSIGQVSSLDVGGGKLSLYYLKNAAIDDLTSVRQRLTYADLLAHSVATNAPTSANDQLVLRNTLPLIQSDAERLIVNLNQAQKAGVGQADELLGQAEGVVQAIETALLALDVVSAGQAVSTTETLTRTAVNDAAKLSLAVKNTLATEAQDQLTRDSLQGFLTLLAILVLGGLAIWLLSGILRNFVNRLRLLTSGSQKLAQGELNIMIPVTSQDELGTLAGSFNTAAAQLRANAEKNELERQEAAALQRNIGEFLDVTMDIAEGDLTKRGKVTEDVLGNVVDSINLMAEELGSVLKNVQHTTSSVTSTSHTMLSTTSEIQRGAVLTAEETQRVAQRVQQITDTIRQMAQNAQTSADTARQVLHASEQGQQAVVSTLDGMQNIRREVQGIAKRIKGLGDRSLEIQEIVDTIAQITEQTHLLAVNASIEAAGAGEAGSRFRIVADSVRKLSTTSAEANNRIAALIKSVQSEVQDVIVDMEDGTREVEQGYRLAGQAGERLREISTLTQQAAQLADQVASSTQAQVQNVEQVDQAVQQIAGVAQQSQQSVQHGRAAAEQLEQLAQELKASLSRFRLPA